MRLIKVLDDNVADKIAAGEVVANPASVIKELVENAVDANSTRINIEFSSGGKENIKVSDDGDGMSLEDLELSFKRHATSKIIRLEDLDNINSMGFRGEALSSIAAVSSLAITSKLKGNSTGYRLEVEGGEKKCLKAVGCSEGTTVEVSDLFYNVPARKKHLKGSPQESYYITEIMTRFVLGHPEIAIRLKNEKKSIFETEGSGKLEDNIAVVYGLDILENLIPVNEENSQYIIKGYISSPLFTKAARKYQHFFVNGRWVANREFKFLLDDVYRNLVPKGRFPAAVLFIDLKQPIIDVNVDPTKNTVRIQKSGHLLSSIAQPLRRALDIDIGGEKASSTVKLEYREKNNKELDQIEFKTFPETGEDIGPKNITEASSTYDYDRIKGFKIIGQLDSCYVLCEYQKDLYIIDQHAAQERIQYEAIKQKEKNKAVQLIMPKTFELTANQQVIFYEVQEALRNINISIEPFGGNTVILREVPLNLSEENWDILLKDILDDLEPVIQRQSYNSLSYLEEEIMKSIACKASIKSGNTLHKSEMANLLEDLFSSSNSTTCPHGRPIFIVIENKKILNEFLRT